MNNLKTATVGTVLFFLLFCTASFDLTCLVNIKGFSLRISLIIIIFIISFSFILFIISRRKMLQLPPGIIPLIAWMLFLLLFIPNAPFIMRSLGYWFFCLLFILFLISSVNIPLLDVKIINTLYLISFILTALFGCIQFFGTLAGLNIPFIRQWVFETANKIPRINGFSYEPSYYATYLIPSLPLACFFLQNKGKIRILGITGCIIIFTAIILSTSRMGIFAACLYLLFIIFPILKKTILSLSRSLQTVVFFTSIIIITAGLFLFSQTGAWYKIDRKFFFTAEGSLAARRLRSMEVLEIFFASPFLGCSLGGVASVLADRNQVTDWSNNTIKNFEGQNIFYELLAASGLPAFFLFLLFITIIIFGLLQLLHDSNNKNHDLYQSLLCGLLLQIFLLIFNQNILRVYFWTNIAVIYINITVISKKK